MLTRGKCTSKECGVIQTVKSMPRQPPWWWCLSSQHRRSNTEAQQQRRQPAHRQWLRNACIHSVNSFERFLLHKCTVSARWPIQVFPLTRCCCCYAMHATAWKQVPRRYTESFFFFAVQTFRMAHPSLPWHHWSFHWFSHSRLAPEPPKNPKPNPQKPWSVCVWLLDFCLNYLRLQSKLWNDSQMLRGNPED